MGEEQVNGGEGSVVWRKNVGFGFDGVFRYSASNVIYLTSTTFFPMVFFVL